MISGDPIERRAMVRLKIGHEYAWKDDCESDPEVGRRKCEKGFDDAAGSPQDWIRNSGHCYL